MLTTSTPLKKAAPNVIGASSRNEKRAAASRVRPSARPAVIVTPEREVPGASATRLREADRERAAPAESLHLAPLGQPVGEPQQDPEHRQQDRDLPRLARACPRSLLGARAPIAAAGTVAITISQPRRSSVASTLRRRRLRRTPRA